MYVCMLKFMLITSKPTPAVYIHIQLTIAVSFETRFANKYLDRGGI